MLRLCLSVRFVRTEEDHVPLHRTSSSFKNSSKVAIIAPRDEHASKTIQTLPTHWNNDFV